MAFFRITPFMHVPDVQQAIAFFRDILGFKVWLNFSDYAYVQRETAGIRLLQNHGNDAAPPGNRRFAYYIDVDDVDAFYVELKPKLDSLPKATCTVQPISRMASANSRYWPPTGTCWCSAIP